VLSFDALGPAAHTGSFAAAFHFGDVGGQWGSPVVCFGICVALAGAQRQRGKSGETQTRGQR
jgi:hypothetical protein